MFESVGEHQNPLFLVIVPEHIGVSCLGFHCYHRVSGINVVCQAVVMADGETLHLAHSGRSIHGNYCIFAESGAAAAVYGTAS